MRFLFNLAVLSTLTIGTAAAQDRVSELDDDVNAAGFTRRSMPLRIGAELGMGLLATGLNVGVAWGMVGLSAWMMDSADDKPGLLAGGLAVGGAYVVPWLIPAAFAGGVYLGGRLTGGRGSFGWTVLGAYGGVLLSLGGFLGAWALHDFGVVDRGVLFAQPDWLFWAEMLTIPILSTIFAYERSDSAATDRLKKKRKDALKAAEEPMMFNLLTLPF